MYFRSYYIFLLAIVTFFGCNKEVEIPAYIKVVSTDFQAGSGQGTSRQSVDFVWVYLDNKLRGAFPLNENIPILRKDEVVIDIYAGYYDNGSLAFPEINFLWKPDRYSETLEADEVFEINASFEYINTLGIIYNEEFNGQTDLINDLDSLPQTRMEIETNPELAYEGSSGRLTVSKDLGINAVTNPNVITEFGAFGDEVLLEMHYKTETYLTVGIIAQNNKGENFSSAIISLFPDEEYKKIYLDIGTILTDNLITQFQIYYQATYIDEFDKQVQNAYVDNLKLIYNHK